MAASNYKLSAAAVAKLAALTKVTNGRDQDFTSPLDKFSAAEPPRYFWAQVVTSGPDGESDYTDERYWVQRIEILNDDDDDTSTLDTDVVPDTSPYYAIVTATNWAEYLTGSHTLADDTPVQVWWEYDLSDP